MTTEISSASPPHNPHRSKARLLAVFGALILVSAITVGVVQFRNRSNQVRTTAHMAYLVGFIENFEKKQGRLPDREELVREVRSGRASTRLDDTWGRPLSYFAGTSYVLASFGRDGKCDLGDVTDYVAYSGPAIDVRGDPDADIVIINGRFVHAGGK